MDLHKADTALCPGVLPVGPERFQVPELTDQDRVIIAVSGVDGHLTAQKLRDHTLQVPQAVQKLRLLRLCAGAELPHDDVPDHACSFRAL